MRLPDIIKQVVRRHERNVVQALPHSALGSPLVAKLWLADFRQRVFAIIDQVFEDRVGNGNLTPVEVDALCSKVERTMIRCSDYLREDEQGITKLINEERLKTRQELLINFYNHCRILFLEKEISDRTELLVRGTEWVETQSFGPFGSGKQFASIILNRPIIKISREDLKELADLLMLAEAPVVELSENDLLKDGSEEGSAERRLSTPKPPPPNVLTQQDIIEDSPRQLLLEIVRRFFRDKGITSRDELLGLSAFRIGTLETREGTAAYFTGLLLHTEIKVLSRKHLKKVADMLDLKDLTVEEKKNRYGPHFNASGIHSLRNLYQTGVSGFACIKTFYGWQGAEFASMIIGKSVAIMSVERLRQIAEAVGMESLTVDERDLMRKVLAKKGITGPHEFLNIHPQQFRTIDFEYFGRGRSFARFVLGKSVRAINKQVMREIAHFVWPDQCHYPIMKKREQKG